MHFVAASITQYLNRKFPRAKQGKADYPKLGYTHIQCLLHVEALEVQTSSNRVESKRFTAEWSTRSDAS